MYLSFFRLQLAIALFVSFVFSQLSGLNRHALAQSSKTTTSSSESVDNAPNPPPNVLLILVDDLKPALGVYGDRIAKTPNLDALSQRSLRFERAYCNQAVCAPSRFTLMLGAHSTSTGLYGLGSQLREILPDAVTMPQYFSQHGYRTESLGKVFHIGHGNFGDPASFDVPHFHEKVIEYVDPTSTEGGKLTREEAYFTNQQLGNIKSLPRGSAFESPDVDDLAYADGRVAQEAIKRLRAAKRRREQQRTPFFIAVGFARPHLPFSAPKKYWDLYRPEELPLPKIEELPADSPNVAHKRGGEITNYSPVPEERDAEYDEDLKRKLIHGYYASTSFVDAQIGKVVDEAAALGLMENTIIVLWGDHGFHLGDLGIWTKHTNYEQATRIPLLIHAPGVSQAGSVTEQLAESVDIFPTLAELAGLPKPNVPQDLDGISLVPVLKDPQHRVRSHAYHVYPKSKLGRAVRTDRYRLVEWRRIGDDDPRKVEYELYDYADGTVETNNLAESEPLILERLRQILDGYPPPVPRHVRRTSKPPQPPGSQATSGRDELRRGLEAHDRALFVKSGWIRDPYIVRGPDQYYYLTGTTPLADDPRETSDPYNTGLGEQSIVGWKMRVWRSRNLIDWESLGTPFSLLDGIWAATQPKAFMSTPRHKWRLWAPELHWLGDRWALVHTSPSPVRGANLTLSSGVSLGGPWSNPMGSAIQRKHDPSLFNDDDGTWWMIWGATLIAPLKSDFSGFLSEPVRIHPTGASKAMGHEGCLIHKIHGKYVLFGTGWSTGEMRKGSYNLYYATSDEITGPYSERKFVGRFLGHGTPFQDDKGRWWCTAFFNANHPPLEKDGIATRDLSDDAYTINRQGVTLVPLEISTDAEGQLVIRARADGYSTPGPDEAQNF